MGNKDDDPESKVVETNDAQKFAEQMGIRLFETSAKDNLNVEDVSQAPVDEISSLIESYHESSVRLVLL